MGMATWPHRHQLCRSNYQYSCAGGRRRRGASLRGTYVVVEFSVSSTLSDNPEGKKEAPERGGRGKEVRAEEADAKTCQQRRADDGIPLQFQPTLGRGAFSYPFQPMHAT